MRLSRARCLIPRHRRQIRVGVDSGGDNTPTPKVPTRRLAQRYAGREGRASSSRAHVRGRRARGKPLEAVTQRLQQARQGRPRCRTIRRMCAPKRPSAGAPSRPRMSWDPTQSICSGTGTIVVPSATWCKCRNGQLETPASALSHRSERVLGEGLPMLGI